MISGRMEGEFQPKQGSSFNRADELDLGQMWRTEKLRDFEWRMRCVGIQNDPEAMHLLRRMLECTQELNDVGDRVRKGEVDPKWWWDGEYDRHKADQANDEGTALFKQKAYGKAFDSFTTAIRLYPSVAVYHCNRAGAGLRLKQYEAVLEDCNEALNMEPNNAKALTRAATALQKMNRPGEAKVYWQKVLDTKPSDAKAKQGYASACREAEVNDMKATQEEDTANRGLRTMLPRTDIGDDWGDALYSSSQMLELHEDSLSARLAYIEALIMCRRYRDALLNLETVPQSTEKDYLQAEAQWRSSMVPEALSTLSPLKAAKCHDLQKYLHSLYVNMQSAALAHEDGRYQHAIDALNKVNQVICPAACSGLYAEILFRRAQAFLSRGLASKALEDMDLALEWESENRECLLLRSKVKRSLKDFQGALSDLSILQSIHASTPDLFKMMQELATLSLKSNDPEYKRKTVTTKMGMDPYDVLGISVEANELEIRRAYRRKAAQWHPDKWTQQSAELQTSADLKFKEIQKAYESLLLLEN